MQTSKEREAEIASFKNKIAAMTDGDLVREAEHYVWLSAYAANNGRSIYHAKCDATYDEARGRGKPWLYQRGWNNAYRTCGHVPSESDINREKPEAWDKAA